jgi:copper chaperone CopZ
MKKLISFKAMLVLVVALVSFTSLQAEKKSNEVKTITFNVAMDCQGCVDKVTKNISFEKGVKDLKTDLKAQQVTIKYRSDKTNIEKLTAAFKKIGYDVTVAKEGEKKAACNHDHDHKGHKH